MSRAGLDGLYSRTGLCYDSALYYQICTFNCGDGLGGWPEDPQGRCGSIDVLRSHSKEKGMVFEMVQRTTQACFECLAAARNSQCKVDFDPPLVSSATYLPV
jgi:hypothetical protein